MYYEDLKKSLIKQTGHLFSSNVITVIFTFAINILIVRNLGAKDTGLIILTITISSMISLFVDLRFGETLIKYLGDFLNKNDKKSALGMISIGYIIDLSLGILCFLIIILCRNKFAHLMNKPQLEETLFIYAFILLIGTLNTTSINIFQSFREFSWLSIQTILHKTFNLIFVIVAINIKKNPVGIIYAYLCSEIIMTIIITTKIGFKIKRIFKRIRPEYSNLDIKKILSFTFHTTLSSTLKSANRFTDILSVGFFCDPQFVTYYKNGLSISSILGLISDPIYKVIYPVMITLRNKNDTQTIKKIIKKIMLFGSIIGGLFGITVSIAAPFIIELLYNGLSTPSVTVLRILLWASVFNLILCWPRPVYLAFGKPELGTKIGLIVFVAFITLLLVLVPRFAHIGAAVSYLIMFLLNLGLNCFCALKIIKNANN